MDSESRFVPTKYTLLTVLLASMMMLLGGAAVAPALPQIAIAFPDAEGWMIDLVVTLPPLAIALTGILIGALADRIGKANVLTVSLLIFGVAGVSGFFIDNLWLLLVGRFFVGIGIAGITACCSALITEYYHGDQRMRALGYQTAAMGLGVLFLEVGGGSLAEMGWHYPFLIYSVGFLIFLMALVWVKEPSHTDRQGPTDNGMFNRNAVIACYIAVFITMMVMYSIPTKLAAFVTETTDASPTMIGFILGLNGVLNSCMCLAYRKIVVKVRREYLISCGLLLMAIGLTMFNFADDVVTILICTCFAGMGVGLASTTIINTLSDSVSPTRSGKIMGGYTTFFNLGQFASTFVITALIAMAGGLRGMYVSMGLIALVFAIAFVPVMLKVNASE